MYQMGFLQCYCDYYNENTQQWQKIEDASRTSYAFGLFLQEMERKPELESNSVKSLFLSPIKVLVQYLEEDGRGADRVLLLLSFLISIWPDT